MRFTFAWLIDFLLTAFTPTVQAGCILLGIASRCPDAAAQHAASHCSGAHSVTWSPGQHPVAGTCIMDSRSCAWGQ